MMNRPALPIAISSVPSAQLSLDVAEFSATIAELLATFDARDAAAEVSASAPLAPLVSVDSPVEDAFRPVSARAHVNQSQRTSTRSRRLASA